MMTIRATVSRPEPQVDVVRVKALRAFLFVVLTGIAPVHAQNVGSFSAGKSTDAMTDKTTLYIETESTTEPETQTEYRPRLVVVCSDDGKDLRAMYSYGKNLSGQRKVVMRYDDDKPYTTKDDSVYYDPRHDNEAARSVSLPVRMTKNAVLLPVRMTKHAVPTRAQTAKHLMIRVNELDGESVTATFDLTGFPEAIKTLPCYKPAR